MFILPIEAISIFNFRKVPNSNGADTNNISFAFEVTSPIRYKGPLTYDIVLSWEEEERGHSGSLRDYYYGARYYFSGPYVCPEYGNLRRNGQTYQFTISKVTLGSGPLYISVCQHHLSAMIASTMNSIPTAQRDAYFGSSKDSLTFSGLILYTVCMIL